MKLLGLLTLVGMVVGVFILHPITMAIYWYEFNTEPTGLHLILDRMAMSFVPSMLMMTGLFAAFGGLLGLTSGLAYRAIRKRDNMLRYYRHTLGQDILLSLHHPDEYNQFETKLSWGWDNAGKKASELTEFDNLAVLGGFMNAQGGSLLLGVGKDRRIKGLDDDVATIRPNTLDGFHSYLVKLFQKTFGKKLARHIHILFQKVNEKDICRIVVEPTPKPVWTKRKGKKHFFLRFEKHTRELHGDELEEYSLRRWPTIKMLAMES